MKDRLRVLEAVDAYLRGTENWIYRLISNLPNTDVVIVSKNFLNCDFYSKDFTYLEFPLRQIGANSKILAYSMDNAFVPRVMAFLYTPYVKKHVKSVDLIHSHFAYVGWRYMDLAKKLKIPHIVSFYGLDYESVPFANGKWKKRYERLFEQADLFLCEGNYGAKALQMQGCPSSKIEVQKLGVDVDSIPFFKREKEPEELRLLQIATFRAKKGHIFTINAFVEALKSCPNMTLTFVGNDAYGLKAKIQAVAQRHDAQDKITFVDWIDFANLHTFMAGYHIFIHPSCYTATRDCEGGAPVVLLDAQATGMPVIATTHCDIPDEVIHAQTGILTPEKDVEGLVNSIRYFYHLDSSTYHTFCANARQHVGRNYDCKHNAAQLKKIYATCVEEWRFNN
jgi:colanic acid/amylovoran biosynthesis glycosyltransferase